MKTYSDIGRRTVLLAFSGLLGLAITAGYATEQTYDEVKARG